jgi:hypothetical protein
VEIQPGPLRVIFEESITHTGAPFRISLSGDGSDDEVCILLDHIPHNDNSRPSSSDASTYTPYVITIEIPDVSCERCSLHLSNPMTDKIGSNGAPSGIGCSDPNGTCFSVYHSCTKPFRIAGTVPRSDYVCIYESMVGPSDWPKEWTGDGSLQVDASVPGVYRRESSVWNTEDSTLETATLRYQQDAGGVCGETSNAPTPVPNLAPVEVTSTTTTPQTPSSVEIEGAATSIPSIIVEESLPESSSDGFCQNLVLLAVSVSFLLCF